MAEHYSSKGLFLGLTTLDLIYQAQHPPQANEKVVANDLLWAAGGPATNAAIAFAALGGEALLVSALGQHPLAHWVRDDLGQYQVQHLELRGDRHDPPTVSSIVVSQDTGDRAVISKNAQNLQATEDLNLDECLQGVDIVLMDGHQMALSQRVAIAAKKLAIPTILDAGSWKPGTEALIPHLDYLIASADFRTPGCGNELETLLYLQSQNPEATLVVTHGGDPITVWTPTHRHTCLCPSVAVVDTLGAGDFFHGAFAWFITQHDLIDAIDAARAIASLSCQFSGTREWLSKIFREH